MIPHSINNCKPLVLWDMLIVNILCYIPKITEGFNEKLAWLPLNLSTSPSGKAEKLAILIHWVNLDQRGWPAEKPRLVPSERSVGHRRPTRWTKIWAMSQVPVIVVEAKISSNLSQVTPPDKQFKMVPS